ncbi:MAG: amidohydrolase family protein [Acetobacteraceae bacterium]|nr:amidohydrolase family protein [Acetobacteraceae bacterium]
MTPTHSGAIDCDIHPGVPAIKALLPYMNEFWRESFVARGLDGFDMVSYPLGAPITCRPDWRDKGWRPGSDLAHMQRHALDAFGIELAICNPMTGGQVVVSESMGAAICSAVNDWVVEHWQS